MTKKEYLLALSKELQSLPYDEQKEALDYYENYFADAGAENEQMVMSELGTVETLGAYIRSKFACVPEVRANAEQKHDDVQGTEKETTQHDSQRSSNNKGLIVILIILSSPIWIGPVLGVLGTILGLIVAALAVGCSGIITAVALFLAGILVLVVGLAAIATTPFSALLGVGLCLCLLGAALLTWVFGVWLCAKAVPAVVRGIVALCRMPFNKARAS